MQAFRVWGTWKDEPDLDHTAGRAYELRKRADDECVRMNEEHLKMIGGASSTCVYVVREEIIPRDIVFNGKPDKVVMVVLGDDEQATDVSTFA